MTAPIELATDADITEALRLAAAATPGPWRVSCHGNVQGLPSRLGTCQQIADVDPLREGEVANREADASLIVAARTLAPRLVSEVRYLRAVSGAWKLLASALILYRGRGNESDVLQAVANLDKLGVKVP